MQFPTQFPFLVIPTGAGAGQQRITINYQQDGKIKVYDQNGNLVDALGGPQGQLILYDSSGNMVVSLASAAGTDDRTGLPFQAGITTYTATTAINLFGNDGTWTASDGSKIVVESGGAASIFFTPQTSVNGPWFAGEVVTSATLYSGGHPSLSLQSPSDTTNSRSASVDVVGSSKTDTTTTVALNATNILLNGITNSNSFQFGGVVITPSAANTPTKATVTFDSPLSGTRFYGNATAQVTVPGTQVTGVSITNITSTTADIYVTRTNTTSTGVYWSVMSKP